MLGRDLVEALRTSRCVRRPPDEVVAVDIAELDITRADLVMDFVGSARPGVTINCAAYTNVDGAESEPELARAVNATGAGNLARACKRFGCRMVHIGTDFIFGGEKDGLYTETDEPRPLCAYAVGKLEGERAVAAETDDYVIARTAWLYGLHGKSFPRAILERAVRDGRLRVVTDQRGSPTFTRDLAPVLWDLACCGFRGIIHAAGDGACARYEQALAVVGAAGLDVPVEPISSAEFKRAARVPVNSALDCALLAGVIGRRLRPWREATGEFARECAAGMGLR